MNKRELNCEQQYEYDKLNEWGREFNLKQRAKSIANAFMRKYERPSAVTCGGLLMDERVYCVTHLTPVSYHPTSKEYICDTCGIVSLSDIISESEMLESSKRKEVRG